MSSIAIITDTDASIPLAVAEKKTISSRSPLPFNLGMRVSTPSMT